MASTWSKLKIELIGTGEQSGTWGTTTNNNLGSSSTYRGLEQAIVGMATLVTGDFTSNSYTMPYTDSSDDQDFRCLFLNITATLSAAGTVIVPAIQKPYIVKNASVGGFAVTVKVSGQTGVSVPNGALILLYNNGTDVDIAVNYLTSLTLGSALPIASGGTGATTLTSNNVILGNGTSAVQFVAPGANGNVLTSNGTTWTSTAPTSTSTLTISNKTGAYTVVSGDAGKIINCTSGTFTVSLTAAASLGSGFNCWVWNTSSTVTDAITINPNGAETIDGVATLILRRGEGCQIVCDGTNWQTGDKKTMRGYAENIPAVLGRPIASGSEAVAISNESVASGQGCLATQGGTASSNYSTAIGRTSAGAVSQAVTNSGAMALGGSYASGADSFAAAIGSNSSSYGATGTNSVAIGFQAKANNSYALSIGGNTNESSGTYSVTIGGFTNLASGSFSYAAGYFAVASIYGKNAFASGRFAANGDAQTGTHILRAATTGAVATVATTDGGAAAATNQVVLPNNSAYAFSALIVARRQASGGTQSAAWKIEGLIRREGSAGTTTLVNSATTVLDNTPGWTIAVSADTTNGGLAITATGAASTNIRWVATVQTSEVTYA
jgi:Head domain of trimeric autotransporter adhesin